MNTRKLRMAALVLAAGLSGAAQAALEGRDLNGSIDSFEAYYDTDLDITWLADANMNGTMNWVAANAWAATLSFTDGVNVYGNWRLPTTLQPDATCESQPGGIFYNCTGSEMGHLFYSELGGTAGQSILTSADPDLAKFTNLQAYSYWSATEYGPGVAGDFSFYGGGQSGAGKNGGFYTLAVSPGDIGIAAIPEPETYAMMLAGLLFIGFAKRHNSKNHS